MSPLVAVAGGVIVAGIALGIGYSKGDTAGRAAIQQMWDKEKAAQYAEYAKGQAEARAKEQELQANADKLRQEKDREIRNISARAAALSNSLRDRSTRPTESSGVPQAANVGQAAVGCTGSGLYRPDGEFLAGEAARANTLRAELKQCYKQYEALENKTK